MGCTNILVFPCQVARGEVGHECVDGGVVLCLLLCDALNVGYALGYGSEFVGGNSEFVDACGGGSDECYLVDDVGNGRVDVGYHCVDIDDGV